MALTRALTRSLTSGLVVPLTGDADSFSPLSLPGLVAWYDASQLGLANGASIATWPDLSGNGHDLTQATSSKQPTLAAGSLNGLNTAAFASASSQTVATAAFTYNSPCTLFLVGKNSLVNTRMTDGLSANTRGLHPGGALTTLTIDSGGANFSGTVAAISAYSILYTMLQGAGSIGGQNGVEFAGSQSATASGIALGSFVSGGFINGNIAEAIFYSSALVKSDRNSVVAYLGAKWGITVTLS